MGVRVVSKFLQGFSDAYVARLIAEGHLCLVPGAKVAEVAEFVAAYLAEQESGQSLIAALAQALEECPSVDELYADDETLRDLANEVPASALPRG